MKKLFLSSYFSCVADLFPDFVGRECVGKKLVFIPTASLPDSFPFYVDADRRALKKLGLIVEDLAITSIPSEIIEKKILSTDYIFVSGGNIFFLLQELRRTSVDKMLIEHINSGKPYIGSSAGSAILSKDIGYIKYMDSPNAAPNLNDDFSALSVVDFCIVPHSTNYQFKGAAAKTIKIFSKTLDIRAISDNQAITVNGDKVETLTL